MWHHSSSVFPSSSNRDPVWPPRGGEATPSAGVPFQLPPAKVYPVARNFLRIFFAFGNDLEPRAAVRV